MLILPAIVYTIILLVNRRNLLLVILLGLQVISMLCGLLTTGDSNLWNNVSSYFYLIVIICMTIPIILPWKGYDKIRVVRFPNNKIIETVTKLLLVIGAYTFVVLAIVAALVISYGLGDINSFKYVEGSTDFYYSRLPFSVTFYNITRISYYYSYILLPLHFYHLGLGNNKLSFWCGVFSLNIILYGLTFFSRWTVVLYVSLYLAYWVIFRSALPKEAKRREKRLLLILGGILLGIFAFLTLSRFNTDNDQGRNYEARIPASSPIQDPALYSLFDYLGQSNENGVFLLTQYNGSTFHGQWSLSEIRSLFSAFGLTSAPDYQELVMKLWPDHYDTFNGFVAYTVYDLGFVLAILFCIFYYVYVKNSANNITINKLLLSSFLLQIPICSIFYSQMATMLYGILLYIPIGVLLNSKSRRH